MNVQFDLTSCKVYVYAKGCPGHNVGALHESCTLPTLEVSFVEIWHTVLAWIQSHSCIQPNPLKTTIKLFQNDQIFIKTTL